MHAAYLPLLPVQDLPRHQLIRELLAALPTLEQSYAHHCVQNPGLMPHIFIWDVARYILTAYPAQDSDNIRRVLQSIEIMLEQTMDSTDKLLAIAFVETLLGEDEDRIRRIKPFMGDRVREELAAIEEAA